MQTGSEEWKDQIPRRRDNVVQMHKAISFIIVFVIGFGAGLLLRPVIIPYYEAPCRIITSTDTLTIRDTVTERMPVPVTVTRVDTMLVPVRDTVTVHDTVYMLIEREQRHYHGDDYDAWVSGWRPALDSIRVYPQTKYITAESISVTSRKCSRWGLGIQTGYGIGVSSGQVKAFPYIGVGISYDIIRW